jgi:hypothetical protein
MLTHSANRNSVHSLSRPSRARTQVRDCPVLVRLAILFFIAAAADGKTVHCKNTYSDARAVQKALRAGGTVTLDGTCAIGSATLAFGSNITINGSATLNYSGSGYIFESSGNTNKITGLTLNGGGIHLTLNDYAGWTGQCGWTIENNTIQNIVSGSSGIRIDNILGKGAHSTISNNTFRNIWTGGYPASNNRDAAGGGIFFENGLDNTTIASNKFDEVLGNAIKGFLDGFAGRSFSYVAHNIVISDNDITLEGRIGIEVQGAGKGNCPGGCNYDVSPSDGTVVKGNYMHNFFTPMNNEFAFSLMFGSTNAQYINNSAVNSKPGPCSFRLAIALETAMNGGIVQGNTLASVPLAAPCDKSFGGPVGWAAIEASGYTHAGYTNYWRNNVYCQPNNNWHNTDGHDSATYVHEAEYMSASCPSGYTSETSAISLDFGMATNQSLSGRDGRWNLAVISNLAIRNASFCVDACSAAFATQEIQDINPHFSKDRKWLYHATLNTSGLGPGDHTITAKATDAAGVTQSATQSFMVGKPR